MCFWRYFWWVLAPNWGHFSWFVPHFGVAFLSMDLALIFFDLESDLYWCVHVFMFVDTFSSGEALEIDDPYSTLACSGFSENHKSFVFHFLFRYQFWNGFVMSFDLDWWLLLEPFPLIIRFVTDSVSNWAPKVLEPAPFLLPYSILSLEPWGPLEGSFWRSLDSFGIPFGFILVARGTLFVPYVSPTRHGPLISILCLFSLVGIEWKQFLSNRLTIALLRWLRWGDE